MSRGSSGAALLTVVAVIAVAAGAWWFLHSDKSPGDGPAPVDSGEGPAPRTTPSREVAVAATARERPKDGVASADETWTRPADWDDGLRIRIPDVPDSLEVKGAVLRDALVATPTLHVRWASEAAREAFLKATFTVPRELTMLAGKERGAPVAMIQGSIAQAGFSAELDPPVLRIGESKVAQPPR